VHVCLYNSCIEAFYTRPKMEGEQDVRGKRAGCLAAHGISSIVADPPGGGPADVKPSSSFFASGGGGEPLSRFIQPGAGRQIRVCAAGEEKRTLELLLRDPLALLVHRLQARHLRVDARRLCGVYVSTALWGGRRHAPAGVCLRRSSRIGSARS
jgi:hypothetical protein